MLGYKSVDSVVAKFNTIVKDLVAVAEREQQNAEDFLVRAAEYHEFSKKAEEEAKRASAIAKKIGSLLV